MGFETQALRSSTTSSRTLIGMVAGQCLFKTFLKNKIRHFGDPGVAELNFGNSFHFTHQKTAFWGCKALSQKKKQVRTDQSQPFSTPPQKKANLTTSGAPSARLGWGMAPSRVRPACSENSSKAAKWSANAACIGHLLAATRFVEGIKFTSYLHWRFIIENYLQNVSGMFFPTPFDMIAIVFFKHRLGIPLKCQLKCLESPGCSTFSHVSPCFLNRSLKSAIGLCKKIR